MKVKQNKLRQKGIFATLVMVLSILFANFTQAQPTEPMEPMVYRSALNRTVSDFD